MEDDLQFVLKIEDFLKHFIKWKTTQKEIENGIWPQFFEKGRRPRVLSNGRQPETNNVIKSNQK